MNSALGIVIDVLWPAILAAVIVDLVKGHLRQSRGSARRREVRRNPARQPERASFDVQLSLVVHHSQRVDEGPSDRGYGRSYTQSRRVAIRLVHRKG